MVPNISDGDEYLLYRKALSNSMLKKELHGVDIKTVLHAREELLARLKANLDSDIA